MNTQKAVTTTAQNKSKEVIQIRRCSEPNEKVKLIYQALNYKAAPFKKKKFRTPDVVFINDLKTKRKRKMIPQTKNFIYICIMSHQKLNYDATTITILSGAY